MSDLGTQLRQARQAAGVSLSGLARRTNFSKSYLGNVETGRRAATADVIRAYDTALGEDVERRGVLRGLAAGAVVPAAVTELIRHGFAAALADRGAADDWEAKVVAYGRRYMEVGAEHMRALLAGDLVVLQQHLERPALWGVAARLMTVYGKSLPSNDGPAGALAWYRMATVAADRSGDREIRTWVRGRSALALAYEGAALGVARDLADQALALTDRPTLGRLNAIVAKAHVAGFAGNRRGALEALDSARRVFDAAGSEEQVSDFAMPEWRFHTFVSRLLSQLGDPRAVDEQEAADRTRPAALPRFATHIELHRGLMMARAGDVRGGIAYAREAMAKLPPERHSLSLTMMMAEIDGSEGTSARTAAARRRAPGPPSAAGS